VFSAIITAAVEFLVLTVITILVDRWLSDTWAVIVLLLGLSVLGCMHRDFLKSLWHRPSPIVAVTPPESKPVDKPSVPPEKPQIVSKPKPSGAPKGTTPITPIVSPDPYAGVPSSSVALYARQEADSLDASATQCRQDMTIAIQIKNKGLGHVGADGVYHSGPEAVQFKFWSDFRDIHQKTLTDLHDSLVYRLGPIATAFQDRSYGELQEEIESAKSNPSQQSWVLCGTAPIYTRDLRQMAGMLESQ
jgi:hypothetical protein